MKSAISIKFKTVLKIFKFLIIFSQNWPFFSTSTGQNTTFSLPKDVFSYKNPFDNSLTVKNSGLGTAFFPVQNVPVFPALLKNVPVFPVLFLSFL